ncbi:RusA family crossover junction endodeoxyribonuclease [Mycolicibacterium fortuitum]|uniref:RusA family crossover junction endodeoxyribonuclease n=1 Tax=Mycolicibacterium fortuitum TaxID=1766 RepID=UPI0027DE6437|nr:RusA family crossover junction endodeoxyribonuclease [Mycolicibacterium fortuitum]
MTIPMLPVASEPVDEVQFFVPGKAAPQGSKRHVGRGILVESSKEVGPWRERVVLAAHEAMAGRPVIDGAVAVTLSFVLPRPKSAPKSKTPPATKRPDLDKLERACLDALTDVVFADDSQVISLLGHKVIAELGQAPGVTIRVVAR